MTPLIIRTAILLVIIALTIHQALTSFPRSYRRYAFFTATGAFGLLMLFNIRAALEGETAPWLVGVLWLFFILMVVSLALLFFSWQRGEMKEKVQQFHNALQEERTRRGEMFKQKQEKRK